MEQSSKWAIRERLIAGILAILGISAFFLSLRNTKLTNIHPQEYLLVLLFTGAIVLADRFPIHLLRGTKTSLINIPIFLLAVSLPAPLAILATGTGLLIKDLRARAKRGLLPRDIASTIGQWMIAVFLGSQVIDVDILGFHEHISKLALLLLCAFAFLAIDFGVFSFSQSLIYEEPFLAALKSVIREGISLEVIQYLIAILGTLAAYENIWSLILLIVPISITYIAFKNIKETRYETVQILNDMADTVDLRDVYTGGHSKRVADLVHRILVQLKISGPEATLIEISARLHDIGKIGIPDDVLLKPGTLSTEEMTLMWTHSSKGAELISKYKDFSRGALMIKHHHERWDGQGYPDHLKEHEIPFGARVIAVADAFDAITSERPYRAALSTDRAVQILLEGRGKQWDPHIINTFVDMLINQADEKSQEHLSAIPISASLSQSTSISS